VTPGTLRLMRRGAVLLLVLGCGSSSRTQPEPGPCEPGSPIAFQEARVTVSPTFVRFDPAIVGTESAPAKLIVSNLDCGTTATVTHAIDSSDEFAIVGGTCGPPLPRLASCEVFVVFRPVRTGEKSGRLVINAGPGSVFNVLLYGTGNNPDAAPDDAGAADGGADGAGDGSPGDAWLDTASDGVSEAHGELRLDPSAYDFPVTAFGTTSTMAATINVVSRFDQPVGPLSASIVGGTSAGDFFISEDTCLGAVLPPMGTCKVSVRFAPKTLGAKLASLKVGFGDKTSSAQLTGTGIDGKLVISPATQLFGTVPVGMKSSFAFTVGFLGTTGRLVFAVAGMNAAEFMVPAGSSCDVSLQLTGSCSIDVTFAPASAGPKSATLVVTDAGGGAVTATLSGTGL